MLFLSLRSVYKNSNRHTGPAALHTHTLKLNEAKKTHSAVWQTGQREAEGGFVSLPSKHRPTSVPLCNFKGNNMGQSVLAALDL